MSFPSAENFLAVLENKRPAHPTLFEPFIHPSLAEQLIWRRGPQLWDTPAHYADTMVSLRERTQADIVILDARGFCMRWLSELLYSAEALCPKTSACVILCANQLQITAAEASPVVCAVGGYGHTHPGRKPFIRMDGTIRNAVFEGAAGWFAPDHAEAYYEEYHDKIAVCGGLDSNVCAASEPLAIHRRIQALMEQSGNQGYLIGSGGEIGDTAYLSLISMLGIYIRYH